MGRVLVGLAVVAAIGFGAFKTFERQISLSLMGRVVERNMLETALTGLPDGLHVALCGAGSPMPDPNRSGPCIAVVAGGKVYIFDAGTGGSRTLGQMRIPVGLVEGIFITHFHSDHIDGLGEMMLQRWVNGTAQAPVPIYGPEGIEDVVDGFNDAYELDSGYRVAHHGEDIVPPGGFGGRAIEIEGITSTNLVEVLSDGDLTISAFEVEHMPVDPAVGYKVTYKDRTVVISGDTKKSARIAEVSKEADLLAHEALHPGLVGVMEARARAAGRDNLAKIMADILDYHASPVEAAETAEEAGVEHLLFYHIVPPLPLQGLEQEFVQGVGAAYGGDVTLGRDGTFVIMPAGSDEITVKNLL